MRKPKMLEKCCCRCEYGDHFAKAPHACTQCRSCTGFRKPLTARDLPDFWLDAARFADNSERAARAESAGAAVVYDSVLSRVGAFDYDLT